MRGIFRCLLAIAMILVAASPARGEDKIDCRQLDLQFPPADRADWTECYRYHHSSAPNGDGQDGASADIEILIADIGTHVVHIDSIVAGRNTYFDKVPVSQKLRGFDEIEKMQDVTSEEGFDRYQIIRFRTLLWKTPADCFGFVKYAGATIGQNGRSVGSRGYVAGYECWRNGPPDRAQIEATLDAIEN
jgi:hypothetical protein